MKTVAIIDIRIIEICIAPHLHLLVIGHELLHVLVHIIDRDLHHIIHHILHHTHRRNTDKRSRYMDHLELHSINSDDNEV